MTTAIKNERMHLVRNTALWTAYWAIATAQEQHRDEPDVLPVLDECFAKLHDLVPRLIEDEPSLRLVLNNYGHWTLENVIPQSEIDALQAAVDDPDPAAFREWFNRTCDA
jgi:hypothetical protein